MKNNRGRPSILYRNYASLIARHKAIYKKSKEQERYEDRYWIDTEESWAELSYYEKKKIIEELQSRVDKERV